MRLTNKQDLFCREYMVDMVGSAAAARAGYSQKAAAQIAANLLGMPKIQERIAELRAERNERVEINADYVLKRLIEIDQMDVADILTDNCEIKPVSEWPKAWRTTLSAIDVASIMSDDMPAVIKKIKWPDKVRNLELLGKHVDVKAWEKEKESGTDADLVDSIGKLIDKLPN